MEALNKTKHLYYIETPEGNQMRQQHAAQVQAQQAEQARCLGAMPKEICLEVARKDYYGEKAFVYDEKNEGTDKAKAEEKAVKEILTGKTGTVLDIPCGTGRFFKIFEELGLDFVGMDVSEDMLMQARGKGKDLKIFEGDIMAINAPDKHYDHSICIRLLEKMKEEEMVAAIKELGRVTKDTMALCLITGDEAQVRNRSRVHKESVFRKAVEDAGFEIKGSHVVREPEMYVWHCEAR